MEPRTSCNEASWGAVGGSADYARPGYSAAGSRARSRRSAMLQAVAGRCSSGGLCSCGRPADSIARELDDSIRSRGDPACPRARRHSSHDGVPDRVGWPLRQAAKVYTGSPGPVLGLEPTLGFEPRTCCLRSTFAAAPLTLTKCLEGTMAGWALRWHQCPFRRQSDGGADLRRSARKLRSPVRGLGRRERANPVGQVGAPIHIGPGHQVLEAGLRPQGRQQLELPQPGDGAGILQADRVGHHDMAVSVEDEARRECEVAVPGPDRTPPCQLGPVGPEDLNAGGISSVRTLGDVQPTRGVD